VVTLLGPKIHEKLKPVYAYAKLPKIEAAKEFLGQINKKLKDPALTPRTKKNIKAGRNDLYNFISLNVHEIEKEVQISQKLPEDIGVQMYTINHQKRPDELKGIVMEYFNGGTLQNCNQSNLSKLGEYQQYLTKLQLAQKLCTCFAAMHDLEICHLDVKPEQFLVRKKMGDGKLTVRLSDYGLAQRRGTILPNPIGTPFYTAPELLLDQEQKASPAMDCWSFGINLGKLFYGPSFNKLNNSEDVKRIRLNWAKSRGEDNYELWCGLCKEMISSLPTVNEGNIIRGLLDPNPDSRWTAEQAGKAFARLVQA
jgi:serine/threonine protein kinase